MNLYQKYMMQPPAPNAIAGRLLRPGQDRRVAGVAPPVPLSKAPSDFFRRANYAKASVMSGPAPWALGSGYAGGRGVSGLSGFNANMARGGLAGFMGGPFAGLGSLGNMANPIFGPFGFQEAWSLADFLGQNSNWVAEISRQVGGDPNMGPITSPYDPADPTKLLRASEKWAAIKNAEGAPSVDAFVAEVEAKMRAAINEADAGTRQNVVVATNRRWKTIEERRVNAFNSIKGLINRVIGFSIPVIGGGAPAGGAGASSGGGIDWSQFAELNRMRDALNRQGSTPSGPAAPPVTPASSGPSITLIVGGIVGLLAIGGIAYVALKK